MGRGTEAIEAVTQGMAFDALAKRRYLMLLKSRTPPRIAAEQLGFTYGTVNRHLKDDPEFKQQVEDVEGLIIEAVESVLLDEALDGNLGAIRMFLHNRASDRWRDEQVIRKELSGPNGGPITLVQANVLALREVLSDESIRTAALEMVAELPSLAPGIIDAELHDD